MQLFQLLVVFAVIATALAGKAAPVAVREKNIIEKGSDLVHTLTKGHSVKAEVRNTATNGLEGLNLKLSAPFNFLDCVVGVKATIADLKKLSPDSLFLRRTVDVADGKLAVDVDYSLAGKDIDVGAEWRGNGLSVKANGNSNDLLTKVAVKTSHTFDGASRAIKATAGAAYELLSQVTSVDANFESGDASAEMTFDTKDEDLVLKVSYKVNDLGTLRPKISLKSGDVTYGYYKKLASGSVDAEVRPGENVKVEWTDNSASGAWKTTVDVPLNDGKTRVSFARDFAL